MNRYLKALLHILTVAAMFALAVIFLPRLIVFFSPFVAGLVIAAIASPLVRFLEKKLKVKRRAGGVFVIIFVLALVIFLLYLAISIIIDEFTGLLSEVPDIWLSLSRELDEAGRHFGGIFDKLPPDMRRNLENLSMTIGDYLGDIFSNMGAPTVETVGNIAKSVPGVFIGVIMAILSAYLFVSDRDSLINRLMEKLPAGMKKNLETVKRGLVDAVGGYFKAQLKIEAIMYVLIVIGLFVLGVRYALLIALGIAVLDFLPFFGTGTVMVPWALIKLFGGDIKMAVGLLIVWGAGQLFRQFIQPKFVGESVGLPALPTLFLLYMGFKLGGVFGMIIAVPVGLILLSLYEEGAFDPVKQSLITLGEGFEELKDNGKDV